MSADRKAHDTEVDQELLQQGLSLLRRVRDVRVLHPLQIERIERRLHERRWRSRPRALWAALATLGLVLAASATFAMAEHGLRSLPLIGWLFASHSSLKTGAKLPDKHLQPTMRKALVQAQSVEPDGFVPPVAPSPEFAVDVPPILKRPQVTSAEVSIRPSPFASPSLSAHVRRPALAMRDSISQESLRPEESAAPTLSLGNGESPVAAEAHSLASVLESWHRTRNPGAALASLEAHEQRYPNGYLNLEARILRAEIYLAQGRETDTLAVLDTIVLSGRPRARELQVLRGELRIKAGRCVEGKKDLGEALEKNLTDALAERAVRALHQCP